MKKYLVGTIATMIFCLMTLNGNLYSQPKKDSGNIYTKWMKLALVGKNQAEIEYFFRNEKDATLTQVKARIRKAVLVNLHQLGIRSLLQKSSDADDYNIVINTILIEIRYFGMEHDEDLRLSIKEEFGIVLERL